MKCFCRLKWLAIALVCIPALILLSCCGNDSSAAKLCDEIISYSPVDLKKTLIRIGFCSSFDYERIEQGIEARFPDVDVVFEDYSVGYDSRIYCKIMGEHGCLPDILMGARGNLFDEYLYDLSGEAFIGNYNLSALMSVMTDDGRVTAIPVGSDVYGVVYSKALFEEHGWKEPESLEEFYSLCSEIEACGIRAFLPCLKYSTTIDTTSFGFASASVASDVSGQEALMAFLKGRSSDGSVLDPMLKMFKDLYDRGIIRESDFSSSATKNRFSLYDGKTAMIPYTYSFYAFSDKERPDMDIGFFGFPSEDGVNRFLFILQDAIAVSKTSMQDKSRAKVILSILEYLSTTEGQAFVMDAFPGISSLKSFPVSDFKSPSIKESLDEGNYLFYQNFSPMSMPRLALQYVKGEISLDELKDQIISERSVSFETELDEPAFATVKKPFSVLQTSFLLSDLMREATGADVALMLNGYFYRSNNARILEGDLNYAKRFYLRGLGDKDYLSIYRIKGSDLKALLERPVINGSEANALYAFSGLKMEYAPWRDPQSNVLSVSFEDGSQIEDDALYTVAAWDSCIDPSFITETVKQFPEYGRCEDFVQQMLSGRTDLEPEKTNRIKIVYD